MDAAADAAFLQGIGSASDFITRLCDDDVTVPDLDEFAAEYEHAMNKLSHVSEVYEENLKLKTLLAKCRDELIQYITLTDQLIGIMEGTVHEKG